MESVRNFGGKVKEFCQSVVEWRSAATGPYLLAVNSLFWLAAFYCEPLVQSRLLVSIACGVVGWDVLLSSSQEHSIAAHIFLWPVRSLFRTSSVGLAAYSWNLLRHEHLEPACWAAYGTVACLLVNPVWRANNVNEKLYNGATACGRTLNQGVTNYIFTPILAVFSAIKYVVTLQFIPPIWRALKGGVGNACSTAWNSTKNGCRAVKEWWLRCVIDPVRRAVLAVGRWLRYWFCAHWWPDLKAWMAVTIGDPLKRAFNYVCFCLVYVFCGHWLPPLGRWIRGHLQNFAAFLKRTLWDPTKRWFLAKCEELRLWLRCQLHRLAVAIRDSILWPVCLLVVDAGKEISLLVYRWAFKPVIDYFYQRYKILETAALIYILGPTCDVIIKNIPEKNPFCDESDVELEGMLPEEMSDVDDVADEEEKTNLSLASFLPDETPLDEEEREFATGLDFPDVDASESSDEEFDLKRPARNVVRRRRKEEQPTMDGGGSYDDQFEELR